MGDSNQTPLLQSVNADGVQTTGQSSSAAEDSGDDGMMQNISQLVDELSGEDDYPPTEISSPGAENGLIQEQNANQVLSEVPADNLAAADDERDEIVEGESAPPLLLPQPDGRRLHREYVPPPDLNEPCLCMRVKVILCIALVIALWTTVFITLVFGAREVGPMRIGVGCSLLLQPNRFFIESLIVQQSIPFDVGPTLYGFKSVPPLDIMITWSDTHNASLEAKIHKDWIYGLNQGSQINVSYNVPSSSSLLLTIAEGSDGYGEWLYDLAFPNTTLSWNIIHGNGLIQQNILRSGSYHIAVGNLNSEMEEVQLNVTARAFIYNTTEAHYTCKLAQGQCDLPLLFLEENHAILTTPPLKQGTFDGEWQVELTYAARWSTYFGGVVLINVVLLVAIHLFYKFGFVCRLMVRWGASRASLLPCIDDNLLSWDASSEPVSEDHVDPEAAIDESSNDAHNRCAICLDTPRDCFFLPCGHFVACFACGVRIASETAICPICRKTIKKVKKIYTS